MGSIPSFIPVPSRTTRATQGSRVDSSLQSEEESVQDTGMGVIRNSQRMEKVLKGENLGGITKVGGIIRNVS